MLDGIISKIATAVAGGVVVTLVGWVYTLNTNQSETKAEVYAAFGTIAEMEQRSVDNEVRSRVNEELREMVQDLLIALASQDKQSVAGVKEILRGRKPEVRKPDEEGDSVGVPVQQIEQRPLESYIKDKRGRFAK